MCQVRGSKLGPSHPEMVEATSLPPGTRAGKETCLQCHHLVSYSVRTQPDTVVPEQPSLCVTDSSRGSLETLVPSSAFTYPPCLDPTEEKSTTATRLSASLFLFFLFLRYKSHIIKPTLLKFPIQWYFISQHSF